MVVPYPQPVAAIQAEEAQSEDEGGEVVAAMPARKQPTNKQSGQQGNYKGWQVSRPLVARLARSCTSVSSMPSLVRVPSTAPTRRTAPGCETRWPGGSGHRLLWPQRLTGVAVGRGISAVVSGQHRQLLLHPPSQVQGAYIWAMLVHS